MLKGLDTVDEDVLSDTIVFLGAEIGHELPNELVAHHDCVDWRLEA